jgi:hypothetical protein
VKGLALDSHSLLLYTEQEDCEEKEDEKQILGVLHTYRCRIP